MVRRAAIEDLVTGMVDEDLRLATIQAATLKGGFNLNQDQRRKAA